MKILSNAKRMLWAITGFFKRLFLPREWGRIYYIKGTDVLPAPLSHEEESDILSRMAKDESLKKVLVERNLRLVVYIAKKFESTGINIEDLISIGTIGLIKGITSYRADKNVRLATYAARCIENAILSRMRLSARKNHCRR